MKKLLLMILAVAGYVGTANAWNDMYLICDQNGNWSNTSFNSNFKFTKISDNDYRIYIPGSYVNNGSWYFRFRDKDDNNWGNICPDADDDRNVTNIAATTNWQNSDARSFYVEQNANAKWVVISATYKEETTGNWMWYVKATYIEDFYTIGFINSDNWPNVYVYAYDNQGVPCHGVWHGTAMTANGNIFTVEVPQGCKVIFNNNDNSQYPANDGFEVTADRIFDNNGIHTVTASAGTYGMATLSSEYALDFTGITGVNAYTITGADKTTGELTKTPVTGKVKAGTGLYIEGNQGASAVIPTTICTEEATGNMLVAATTEKTISQVDGSYTNYILTVNKADDDVDTPKFFKVNTAGNTVLAGKAYLQIPTTEAARMSFWFNDSVSAIEGVEQASMDGPVYNVAGQRVAQPVKGLYIANGKKFIKK